MGKKKPNHRSLWPSMPRPLQRKAQACGWAIKPWHVCGLGITFFKGWMKFFKKCVNVMLPVKASIVSSTSLHSGHHCGCQKNRVMFFRPKNLSFKPFQPKINLINTLETLVNQSINLNVGRKRVLDLIIKLWFRFRSCHLVLRLLGNLTVSESPGKGQIV